MGSIGGLREKVSDPPVDHRPIETNRLGVGMVRLPEVDYDACFHVGDLDFRPYLITYNLDICRASLLAENRFTDVKAKLIGSLNT